MEPLIFLAAMAALFWFLLIRPQRRRQSQHQALIAGLSTGDEIVTAGGIFGTVQTIADDHVVLEIAPGTKIKVAKEAVANAVPKPEPEPPTAEDGG
ncbi:MAG TPA: preprotein translocase subunit YajC [Gaiellaceae bacterium]|nr:preprotein translocase subunit YajC [Gaiellaceae bacterium]HEX2495268.1 preprotein translocase subunit YajC [Gaiellaceae bacterium]